jgi:hypothetical protein
MAVIRPPFLYPYRKSFPAPIPKSRSAFPFSVLLPTGEDLPSTLFVIYLIGSRASPLPSHPCFPLPRENGGREGVRTADHPSVLIKGHPNSRNTPPFSGNFQAFSF